MAYRKSTETRERILEAAASLFAERGYYEVGVGDIAAADPRFLVEHFGANYGGWLHDTYGTYHWLYIASAGVGIAAAAMALAFPPATKDVDGAPGRPQAA